MALVLAEFIPVDFIVEQRKSYFHLRIQDLRKTEIAERYQRITEETIDKCQRWWNRNTAGDWTRRILAYLSSGFAVLRRSKPPFTLLRYYIVTGASGRTCTSAQEQDSRSACGVQTHERLRAHHIPLFKILGEQRRIEEEARQDPRIRIYNGDNVRFRTIQSEVLRSILEREHKVARVMFLRMITDILNDKEEDE